MCGLFGKIGFDAKLVLDGFEDGIRIDLKMVLRGTWGTHF
jgi:hypothetical protein